jgi:hypothetical protein
MGGVHGVIHRHVPPWTARPPGQPGDGLHERPASDRRHLRFCNNPEGTDDAVARPLTRVLRLRGVDFE